MAEPIPLRLPSDPPWLRQIEVPRAVHTFFQQRGKFFSSSRVRGEVSYQGVIGAVPVSAGHARSAQALPFTNLAEEDRRQAEAVARRAVRFIFGPGRYQITRRSLMQDGATLPVRVNFRRGAKATRDVLYIKKPDTNRMVGRFLYDIISGMEPVPYAFNRDCFVEAGVSGSLLSTISPDAPFLHMKEYGFGLARAAAHADFLGMYYDVVKPRNRIVDERLRTVLFDFNLLFRPRDEDLRYELLTECMDEPWYDQDVLEAFFEEEHAIVRRVEEHHKPFFKLARIAGGLTDNSYQSIDSRIRAHYGAQNLEDYFEKKLVEYRYGTA